VEPETPPQENLSVPAAQPQSAAPTNRKHKTKGAFGKAKPKTLADYFPMPRRLNRQQTFAANAVPPERDQLAEYVADDLGWKPKDWKPDSHQS
jgi:hypothetical protein